MKKVLFGLILLSLLAAVAVALATRSPFEEAVLVANTKEWGPQGQAALEQYPTTAPRVFALYGHTPEFAEVLRRYGHNQLVPVVAKCLEGGDAFIQMREDFREAVEALFGLRRPEFRPLDSVQCGWRVILLTHTVGNSFLGQFVIDEEGRARRLPGNTALSTLKQLTTSGLQTLERRLVLGEVPTLGEIGIAGLDVAVLGFAGKSVALMVRSRLALQTSRTAVTTRVTAARGGMMAFTRAYAPRMVKYGTVGGIVYLAVYHPSVITAAAATLAEILGWSPLLVQVLLWGVILFIPLALVFPALWVLSTLIKLPALLLWEVCRGAVWLARKSSSR